MMTYFETLSRYVPDVVEAGAPILINEVALIKDTVDNEILLRITMANSVEDPVIAVAVKIHMWDVFGDEVAVNGSPVMDYVYQDMIFSPQSIYGNTVAIKMPGSVRRVEVKITRVVFSNGKVWRTVPENYVHVQAQDLLEGTDEFLSTLRDDGEKYPPLLTYIDNEESWQCTCGGVNKISDNECYRCGRRKDYCKKEYSADPIHNKFTLFLAEKERIAAEQKRIEEERKRQEEEALRIKKEQEAEALRQKQEKEAEERRVREEIEQKKKQKMQKRRNTILLVVLLGAVIAGGTFTYINIIEPASRYKKAHQYMNEGNYADAEDTFGSLGDYEDSLDQSNVAKAEGFLQTADSLIESKDLQSAYDAIQDAKSTISVIPSELRGDLEARAEAGRVEVLYQSAIVFMDQQKYGSAIKNLKTTLSYKDSQELLIEAEYGRAKQLIGSGEYEEALPLLKDIGDYENAIELYNDCILKAMEEGGLIEFGLFENDGDESNGPEPIRWRVLEIKDDHMLIVSKAPVRRMKYANQQEFSWENSVVREWLNADFYEGAFSESQRKKIMETAVKTGLKNGKEEMTKDRIFIPGKSMTENHLSKEEWMWSTEDNLSLSVHTYGSMYSWLRNPSDKNGYR